MKMKKNKKLSEEQKRELSVARFIYDNYDLFAKGYYKGVPLMNLYDKWKDKNDGELISRNQRVMPQYMKLYCFEDSTVFLPNLEDSSKTKRYHTWKVNKTKMELKRLFDKNNT